jgi:hypothetical protein
MRTIAAIFLALITLSCFQVKAQYFNKATELSGTIESYTSIVINDSVLICAGFAVEGGYYRRYFARLDYQGNLLSDRVYFSGAGNKHFYDAFSKQPAIQNNVWLLSGRNSDAGDYDRPALTRIDEMGDTLWMKEYDFDTSASFGNIISIPDNKFFAVGFKATTSASDALIAKLDSNGTILWDKTIGGAGYESVMKADTLSSTRYLISGNKSYIPSGFTDAWMCLLDSAGNFVSQRTFGYAYGDGGFATVMNADTILFHGSYETPPNPIAQKRVGFVILCDANLNFLDTLTVEGPDQSDLNNFFGAIENKRNEYVLIGNIYDYDQLPRAPIGHLICLDKNLNLKWERKFKAREASNYPSDIALMPDGGYIISGYVFPDGSGTTQDGWLVRTNCLGWLSKPVPQFTAFNTGNNTVRFHNYSKFAEKYLWDFGDGWSYTHATSLQDSLSSVPYVEHTYATPGNYTATLYAIACGDTMTITQTIVADPVSVTEANEQKVKVYPNPTGGNAFIESPTLANYHTLQVFNEAGQLVYSTSITSQATRLEIPSSNWANGAYVVVVQGVDFVEKLVLMKTE